ncbi:MAG: molybdopterin dinucleotide binding domain-containing protein [Promethearchaeota archaeon]
MEMILNTVRIIEQDQAKEYTFGDYQSLKDKLAVGIINPEDFKKLQVGSSLNVKLISKYGEVIVAVKQDENVPQGMIIMPVSIWANEITGFEREELYYKNLFVKIEVTNDKILDFKEIITKIKTRG